MFTAILSIAFFFCSFKNSHKQSAAGSFSDSRWSFSQSGLSGIYHKEKSIFYNSINYNTPTHVHLPTTIFICLQCIANDYCYGPLVDCIKQYPFS
ncbi:hypothetical protein E2320_021295 [Naja naja]|nr:hypothetical protein E2320_021295 [Naja naja]